MTKKESAATLIVELTLDKVSAKARTGEPSDDVEDIALPLWTGILPISTTIGDPITAHNASHIGIPPFLAPYPATRPGVGNQANKPPGLQAGVQGPF
jgi:hypothetical protein